MNRSGAHTRRGPIGWLTRGDILAPLLVVTVLVCHGAYGAMHQVVSEANHARVAPAHAASMGEGSHSGIAAHGDGYQTACWGVLDCLTALLFPMDAHGDGPADAPAGTPNHIAALLLLTSAAAWLLAFAAAPRGLDPAARPPMGRPIRAPGSLRLPPGPSLARLQVLRL